MRYNGSLGKLRSSVSFILFFTFLFNSFGITFVFWHLQTGARETMKQHLKLGNYSHSSITQIIFQRGDEPVSLIDDDEILYNDTKYDILAVKYTKHFVIYHCIQDENESRLIGAFVRGLLNEMQHGDKYQPVKNILDTVITSGLPPSICHFMPNFELQYLITINKTNSQGIVLRIPTPPPRTA